MIDDLFVDGLQNIDVPGGLCSPEFGGEFGCRVGELEARREGTFGILYLIFLVDCFILILYYFILSPEGYST